VFISVNLVNAQEKDTASIAFDGMCNTFLNLRSIQIEQITRERIDGEMIENLAQAKIQFQPNKKIYVRSVGEEGETLSEVLYDEEVDKEDALVNPVKFPYINLHLNPMGSIMRKNHHHTIFEAGGGYLADVISKSIVWAKEEKEYTNRFQFFGMVEYKGRSCYHIEINNHDYGFSSYTVKKGEDLNSIAKTRLIPEFIILEENDDVDDYDDVKEGQVIQVPNYYGKRIVIYVEVGTFIPWYQRIEDHKGVFAEYEMNSCYLNPEFNNNTFNEDNDQYGF